MRIENSIRNIFTSVLGQFINIGLNFITRSIFIKMLGNEYLGLNGLFTNIISILTLAEMGIGSAIIYSLYRPIAEKDNYKIKCLLNFYNSTYKVISFIILILGILIVPIIPYIAKTNTIDDSRIIIIYILFLLNAVASYLYSYKRSIIIANQKDYILSMYKNLYKIILNLLQVIILIISRNYIIFLLIQIIMTLLENINVSKRANKIYPILLEENNDKLNKDEKKEILKNVRALLYHKIGGVMVNSTDNIIISRFIGVNYVGIYSNYCLITGALNLVIGPAFNAITASIGNLNVLESKEKCYETYKSILFINFWIAGFCSICLFNLLNPFISIWIGELYIFDNLIVLLIVVNFYMLTIRRGTLVYKDSLGLFWNDRYKPIIESILNMVISILLVPNFGIMGVLTGTFISTLLVSFWVEPFVLYKYGFNRSVMNFFKLFIKYTFIIIISFVLTNIFCLRIDGIGWSSLIKKLIICIFIPNMIFTATFYKKREFKYIISIMNRVYNKFNINWGIS